MLTLISRRLFLALTGSALAVPRFSWAANEVPSLLDHILLGCSDLDRGIAFVQEHLGVRAAFGGVHPGRGTRNALVSLAEPTRDEINPRRYLEIIAPDPQQTGVPDSYGLQKLTEPGIVGWAAHLGDLETFAAKLRSAGIAFEGPASGSRQRPDGRVLRWKTLNLKDTASGLLPFFIEWSADSPHPSVAAPKGCHLSDFELLTLDPDALAKTTKLLGLSVAIAKADKPQLHATLSCAGVQFSITS